MSMTNLASKVEAWLSEWCGVIPPQAQKALHDILEFQVEPKSDVPVITAYGTPGTGCNDIGGIPVKSSEKLAPLGAECPSCGSMLVTERCPICGPVRTVRKSDMKESHSAPERSESDPGRHGLTCGIDRQCADLSVDSLERQANGTPPQRYAGPEMGNRQSSAHDSGSVRRGNEVECYHCGPREMALGRCLCLRSALRRSGES